MTSLTLIGAAVAIFVVAALLFWQSTEGFVNVPADLHRAPVSAPAQLIPPSTQRPMGIPGAITAPKEAMATRKELAELDNKLMTWLDAASQRELDNPAALTPEQHQKRVIYQARVASLRQQLGTGLVTDSSRQVNAEILAVRHENAGWQQVYPALDTFFEFAKQVPDDAFLTPELYTQFRGLFQAGLHNYQGFTQPDPLQAVRLKQLEVIAQDLQSAERKTQTPPIRAGVARLFLQQMTKPDQPLPSLINLDAVGDGDHTLAANPVDVIQQLRNIQWTFLARYDPVSSATADLERSIASTLDHLQSGKASPAEVVAIRNDVSEFQNYGRPIGYNPKDLRSRATTLCKQVREAFPRDAEALGCPSRRGREDPQQDEYNAETVINTVCARLRESVPTVTPEQFNCPRQRV